MKFLKSVLAAGFVILILSFVFSFICQALFNYDMLKIPGMRSQTDPLLSLFFLLPFMFAFGMTFLFTRFKGTGVDLGIMTWVLFSLPSALIIFSTMDYPFGFMVNEVIGGLGMFIPAGIVIEKMYKK